MQDDSKEHPNMENVNIVVNGQASGDIVLSKSQIRTRKRRSRRAKRNAFLAAEREATGLSRSQILKKKRRERREKENAERCVNCLNAPFSSSRTRSKRRGKRRAQQMSEKLTRVVSKLSAEKEAALLAMQDAARNEALLLAQKIALLEALLAAEVTPPSEEKMNELLALRKASLSDGGIDLLLESTNPANTDFPSEHFLISDVTPELLHDDFFSCTVEDAISIHVTDYTANDHTFPVTWLRAPSELSQYLFRIDMTGKASECSYKLQKGEVWRMDNVRLKHNNSLCFDGEVDDLSQCRRLDRSGDDPHLYALLQRKEKFENDPQIGVCYRQFDWSLIGDMAIGRFYSCTVEVLYVDVMSPKAPIAYVTDYSRNNSITSQTKQAHWNFGLSRSIVKVVMEGEQQTLANYIQPGMLYRIKNFRLMFGLCGVFVRLQGYQKLVIAVDEQEQAKLKPFLR
ncbi:hypothetical protein P692DRAFT_20880058 [Suillus brevipes Sb2]|nr:hypothetical protein P692DRAFT_20880058 [Suillus brevipes Sb2]